MLELEAPADDPLEVDDLGDGGSDTPLYDTLPGSAPAVANGARRAGRL